MLDPHEALNQELSGRYAVEDVLGEGGMGTVYRARDLKHDRLVAVKTVRPDLVTDWVRERFVREISITAHLQHPHILPLLDSGIAGKTLYYVMPFVEGESLEQRLARDGALPIDEAVRIIGDVAEGLEYAHGHDVIHRDIKPGNILLTASYAQIADFGIAKALAETTAGSMTATGWGPGSPNYMDPDQLSGVATPRTDIYSLGLVLYEAITGKAWRTVQSDPDWTGVPRGLRQVILRAIEPSPDSRWASAEEFREALHGSVGARERRRAWTVGAIAAMVLAVGTWLVASSLNERGVVAESGPQSLAVLPLVNLIGDSEQDYFVAGMHEALISELAKIGALNVISRTSVTRYADTELSVPEIAGELGVSNVLEGGVQKAGDRVRVNVQLIEASSDRQLWGESYDQELTTANIFAIQSDIARAIAEALEATLAPEVEERIQARPTESLEAYDLHTRGRYLYNRFSNHEDRVRAAGLFQQAIAADPAYAPAYVGLAEAYSFLGGQGYPLPDVPPEEVLPRARAAVERALELDETLAGAHAALGSVLMSELRFGDAEQEFLRALDLNPSSADVHRQYGRLLNRLARADESVREGRRAVQLDPLSIGNRVSLTSRLFNARDYEAAIAEGLKVLELAPDDVGALFFLGISYVLNGQFDVGVTALRRAAELDRGNQFRTTALAFAYARFGRRDEAIELLQPLEERGPILKEIAIVYAELGELDRAFEYLERAFTEDPGSLTFLPSDPTADSLRADPRLSELLRRVGLE